MARKKAAETPEDQELKRAIAGRIKEAREALGLTQRKIQGYDPKRAESAAHWPQANTLAAVCHELKVSADWVLFGKEPGPTAAQKPPARERFEMANTSRTASRRVLAKVARLPDAVVAFLAQEGHGLSSHVVERLRTFDYSTLQMDPLTVGHVRRLAEELALEEEATDD